MTHTQEAYGMEILSPAFKDEEPLPIRYTCDGENLSPPLEFKAVPQNTKSLVLIFDDPEAVKGTWIHWILFNLPPNTHELKEGIKMLPQDTKIGLNSWKKVKYGGACPPDKEHRYKFTLYALDIILDLEEGSPFSDIEKAMKGHVLEMATLTSPYKRPFH